MDLCLNRLSVDEQQGTVGLGVDIFPMTMCCQQGGLPEEIGVAQLRESRAPCRRQIDLALLNKIQPHCGVAY